MPTVTPAAWAALSSYAYPGNVREFSHAIEHACILSGGRPIDLVAPAAGHRPRRARAGRRRARQHARPLRPLQLAVKEFEREYLARAVRAAGGRRGRAAEMLGISRKSLWEKLRAHGIAADETEEEPFVAST